MAAPAETLVPLPTSSRRNPRKLLLWGLLGLAALFVFITSEVWLAMDYPLYHGYRLQLIKDRYLLIPHAVCGTLAFLSGPLQFSTRLRQRSLRFHSVLGRVYVFSVFLAASIAFIISWGRPLFPATATQGGAWILCTAMAFLTARNRQIAQHRQWMMRSYAVTFTFVAVRVLDPWPKYFNISDAAGSLVIIITTFASVMLVDIGLSWRDITTKRS